MSTEGKRWPDGEEVWVCRGCWRVGTSARHLLEQGCEGRPEQVLPASEVERLTEALREITDKLGAYTGRVPDEMNEAYLLARAALHPDEH